MIIYLYFLFLFLIYSVHDIKTHEVPWKWLIIGMYSVLVFNFTTFWFFLVTFAFLFLLYQFITFGGADLIVLAMISAILGPENFFWYLILLTLICVLMLVKDLILKKKSENIAFIPYLTITYLICIVFVV